MGWETSVAVRLGEALAFQQPAEHFGVPASHVGIGLAFRRTVAEVAPTADNLLGRTSADAELEATARDEIRHAHV
ncbi:MAG TPA: hypothetical protein VG651_08940 [Stellaceae bacterium]|nr:hypothetical protein [Stellaceae bacterium]